MLLALGGASAASACSPRGGGQSHGRLLIFGQSMEPTQLNTALSTASPASFVASKIFDGLLAFDLQGRPKPQLAQSWDISPDGLTYRFQLQPGVTWHDGTPFTSDDVAYTLTQVWKVFHSRGRTTFANVVDVQTPSPSTVVLKLSQPAPYLLSCLSASESTVLPKHLYAGTDILTNPHNVSPVGSGPFRFVRWQRGAEIVLERNRSYWAAGTPKLDGIVVRFMPDSTAAAVALESGTVDLIGQISRSEAARLQANPSLVVQSETPSLSPLSTQFEFNLDRPFLKDVRVRQAFAHAIDRDFIAQSIIGSAEAADSPVPLELTQFHAPDLPRYAFDLDKANALLDQSGLVRAKDGVRLRLHLDYADSVQNTRIAAYIRSTLARAGIDLSPRPQDQGEYINRVYSRRDFDTCMTGSGAGRDPAVGVQRYYWSKNFKRGVAFSNGAHYANPEVDRLLETAQVELDPAKRRDLYYRFQRIAMTDLPYLPLAWTHNRVASNRRVKNVLSDLAGLNGNFAGVDLA